MNDQHSHLVYNSLCTGNPKELATPDDQISLAVLLLPGFSWMTYSCLIEPFRQVNRLLGRAAYDWTLVSCNGDPVQASDGAKIVVDTAPNNSIPADYLVACAGINVLHDDTKAAASWFRYCAAHGAVIGAVSTGTHFLAEAGLLNGYSCTAHWETHESLRERYPDLKLTTNTLEIDRRRITCSGAMSCLEMSLTLIREHLDQNVAIAVSKQFNLNTSSTWGQALQLLDISANQTLEHPKVAAAVRLMETEFSQPYTLATLAERVGISSRQLERLFQMQFKCSVMRYYKSLRLQRANILLTQTHLPVSEVALSCGFQSAQQFSRVYSTHFGHSPLQDRKANRN